MEDSGYVYSNTPISSSRIVRKPSSQNILAVPFAYSPRFTSPHDTTPSAKSTESIVNVRVFPFISVHSFVKPIGSPDSINDEEYADDYAYCKIDDIEYVEDEE